MNNQPPLLEVVEDFLKSSNMGETYLGKTATGNSELVKRLRAGGRVLVETDQAVRKFILDKSPSRPTKRGVKTDSLPANKRGDTSSRVQPTASDKTQGAS